MNKFLQKAFPFLSIAASTFGGPIGAAGAQLLGAALGKDVKPEDIQEELGKLAATEEGRLKAQQAEESFKLSMQKLGFDSAQALEQIAAADRASAREREIKTGDKTPKILAVIVLVAWIFVQSILIFHVIDGSMRELVSRLLGTLDSALMLVLAYYFGSSSGSARKDEIAAAKSGI